MCAQKPPLGCSELCVEVLASSLISHFLELERVYFSAQGDSFSSIKDPQRHTTFLS